MRFPAVLEVYTGHFCVGVELYIWFIITTNVSLVLEAFGETSYSLGFIHAVKFKNIAGG